MAESHLFIVLYSCLIFINKSRYKKNPDIKGQGAVRAKFTPTPTSDLYNFYVYCILITLFCFNTTIGML